ncbi:hypothetical protein [Pseudooceanicola sp.]|uniref:hypothetical protein n=1 Tax=Pseudooceanicola sp. TaxID=1914328 RepID=UPI0035C76031
MSQRQHGLLGVADGRRRAHGVRPGFLGQIITAIIADLSVFSTGEIEFSSTAPGTGHWIISETDFSNDGEALIAAKAAADDSGSFAADGSDVTINFDEALYGVRTFQVCVENAAGVSNILVDETLDFGDQLGPEEAVDGGFDTTSGWNLQSGITISGSQLIMQPTSNYLAAIRTISPSPFAVGETARLTLEDIAITSLAGFYVIFKALDGSNNILDQAQVTVTADGDRSVDLLMPVSTAKVRVEFQGRTGLDATAESYSLREVI